MEIWRFINIMLKESVLLEAINSPFKSNSSMKKIVEKQNKEGEVYLLEIEKRFSSSENQMKKRFTI